MSRYWSFLLLIPAILISWVTTLDGIPTSEESLEELVSSGVSENAAAGIVKFDRKLQEPFELEKTDPVKAKELEQVLHEDFNQYIESLSENDQIAYQLFIKKKNSQL